MAGQDRCDGLLERHGEGAVKRAWNVVQHSPQASNVADVRENVEQGSTLYTDALPSYDRMAAEASNIKVIDHAESMPMA